MGRATNERASAALVVPLARLGRLALLRIDLAVPHRTLCKAFKFLATPETLNLGSGLFRPIKQRNRLGLGEIKAYRSGIALDAKILLQGFVDVRGGQNHTII